MLTDVEVRKAKPADTDRKLTDGAGLYLLIRPTGSKLWRFDFSFSGKRKTISFGAYPEVSILEARRLRNEAKSQVKAGIDPSQKRKLDKLTKAVSTATTFGLISA